MCALLFLTPVQRFGLLHRIPPQPEDRIPGSVPPELQEQEDEYGSQDLFVPADVDDNHADWRREEQEHWSREVLSRESHIQTTRSTSSSSLHHGDHNHGVHNHDFKSPGSPDISMPRPLSRDHTNPPRIHSPLSPKHHAESSGHSSLR